MVTSFGRTTYTYDKNGNQTTVTAPGKVASNTYDALNRLETATIKDDSNNLISETVNMYNGDGQRISKSVSKGDNQKAERTNYYYQDGVVSYTTDASGKKTSHNIIGLESNIISTKRHGSDEGYHSYNKEELTCKALSFLFTILHAKQNIIPRVLGRI